MTECETLVAGTGAQRGRNQAGCGKMADVAAAIHKAARDAARVADRRSAVSDVELALALTSSTVGRCRLPYHRFT